MSDHLGDGRPTHPRRVGFRLVATALFVAASLAALVWLVGVGDALIALDRVPGRQLVSVVLAGLVPLLVWGLSLRVVFGGVGIDLDAQKAVSLFVASVFLNNVTPLGQVGGDPPSGALIAFVGGTSFERGLAAITGLNAVNRVAVVVMGLAGLVWFGGSGTTTDVAGTAAAALVGWTVIGVAVVGAWIRREAVLEFAGPPLAAAIVRLAGRLPFVRSPTRASLVARLRRFVAAIERLAADPRRLAVVFALGVAGHLAVAATLWLALAAFGVRASLALVLVVLPLAKLSGLVPTPGGAGSATVVLVGLLVAAGGVAAPVATAAALVYRAAAFWLPTVLGALTTLALVARTNVE